MTAPGLVTLLSDFGPGSVYVGQMHAVMLRVAPDLRILDLAHDLPFGGTEAAAYVLKRSWPHCPPATVHVVIVDPEVGTDRAILAVAARGHRFVGPDNGVLDPVLDGADDVRAVENRALMAEHVSSTFHGRDVMAPVAARLATGTPLDQVGPPYTARQRGLGPTREGASVAGRILIEDRFGNLITNIPRRLLDEVAPGGALRVRIGAAFIDGLSRTFADVSTGMALAYVGSGDHLEIAVNGARASTLLGLGVGAMVRVEARP